MVPILDPSIYEGTLYEIVGGGDFYQSRELSPRFARQQQLIQRHLVAKVVIKRSKVEHYLWLSSMTGNRWLLSSDVEKQRLFCDQLALLS